MNAIDAAFSGQHAWSLARATEVTPPTMTGPTADPAPGLTSDALESWVSGRLGACQASLDRLLAAASRTLESTWRLYDDAIAALSQAGSECGLLDSVYPSKPVRDKAQQLAQRVAEVATALSLNQGVYQALATRAGGEVISSDSY